MGKAESFGVPGLELLFFPGDHDPPHLHVHKQGNWKIKVNFMTCRLGHLDYKVVWARSKARRSTRLPGPSGREKKAILDGVLDHREALFRQWEKVLGR